MANLSVISTTSSSNGSGHSPFPLSRKAFHRGLPILGVLVVWIWAMISGLIALGGGA
jgi:hypothetical protein